MSDDLPLILIAERDLFMRNVLTRMLQEHFQLTFVQDGAAVLEQVKAHQPALVILEAMLPNLDGFQVCQQLKNDPATRHIPVVFYTLLWAEEQAARAGADAFLLKPQRKETLLETINRLLAAASAGEGE